MTMLWTIPVASVPVTITVAVHSIGLAVLLKALMRPHAASSTHF